MLKKTKVRTFRDESANKEIPPQIQQLRPTPPPHPSPWHLLLTPNK